MERLKQRLDELELIQNNIKLLNELLSHYRPDSREDEKLLIKVCNILPEATLPPPQTFPLVGSTT